MSRAPHSKTRVMRIPEDVELVHFIAKNSALVFHVTAEENVPSILESGLEPRLGDYATQAHWDRPAVFFSISFLPVLEFKRALQKLRKKPHVVLAAKPVDLLYLRHSCYEMLYCNRNLGKTQAVYELAVFEKVLPQVLAKIDFEALLQKSGVRSEDAEEQRANSMRF